MFGACLLMDAAYGCRVYGSVIGCLHTSQNDKEYYGDFLECGKEARVLSNSTRCQGMHKVDASRKRITKDLTCLKIYDRSTKMHVCFFP